MAGNLEKEFAQAIIKNDAEAIGRFLVNNAIHKILDEKVERQ